MPQTRPPWRYVRASEAYLNEAAQRARYEQLSDGTWYGSIPGFAGIWASGHTYEAAQRELREALVGWVQVHVEKGGNPLPDVMLPKDRCEDV